MDFINGILDQLNGYLYGYILIALLILAGLYFTIRTKFIQFRMIGESIALLREKNDNKEAVSSF